MYGPMFSVHLVDMWDSGVDVPLFNLGAPVVDLYIRLPVGPYSLWFERVNPTLLF